MLFLRIRARAVQPDELLRFGSLSCEEGLDQHRIGLHRLGGGDQFRVFERILFPVPGERASSGGQHIFTPVHFGVGHRQDETIAERVCTQRGHIGSAAAPPDMVQGACDRDTPRWPRTHAPPYKTPAPHQVRRRGWGLWIGRGPRVLRPMINQDSTPRMRWGGWRVPGPDVSKSKVCSGYRRRSCAAPPKEWFRGFPDDSYGRRNQG